MGKEAAATATAVSSGAAALAILAASLRSPHGASPEELAVALADNKARADLDRELLDGDGFPVMTARCRQAKDEALQDEITEWLARHGMADLRFSDEQWRALALGTAVAEELAMHAENLLASRDDEAPLLQLIPILPPEWPLEQRRAAGMWLEHTVARSGWPSDHLSMAAECTPDPHAAPPAAVLDRLARAAATTDVRVAALLVACASHIGDESVAQWADEGSLFTSSHPQGRMPGEGAAGLLVVDSVQASTIEGGPFVRLERMEEARRDSSADAGRRVDSTLLGEVAERALVHGGAGTAMVVADTGHRSTRVLELMGFVSGALPGLDDAQDVVRVGEACGSCGPVPFMTALAMAQRYALEREAPVLCVSNEDAYRRGAVLLRPVDEPSGAKDS